MTEELQRVQKLLSNYGYCSRRKAEELIDKGCVAVNGKVISLGDKASGSDTITVNGKTLKKERKVYLMFNKPLKCVTALRDTQYKTIMSYIKVKERVFPVGRLDYYTSGLLILTNDGDFANKIMHPRYEIKKTYAVALDKPMKKEDIRELQRGVTLSIGKTSPAKVRVIEPDLVEVTIHEGKNRIVRRMMRTLGYAVKYLHRTKIGGLTLGSLKEGQYRSLTDKEKKKIFT